MPEKLMTTTKVSYNGTSLRITLPKEIAEKLRASEKDYIGFYEVDGEIVVRKIE